MSNPVIAIATPLDHDAPHDNYDVLQIDFLPCDTSAANAILLYEYNFSNYHGQVVTPKTASQEITTYPTFPTLFMSTSPSLVALLQENLAQLHQVNSSTTQNNNDLSSVTIVITKATIYSTAGFVQRNAIKHELEAKLERRNLWWCCVTCGLAICCAGCCPCARDCLDAEQVDLTDDGICRILQERFPAETTPTQNYTTIQATTTKANATVLMEQPTTISHKHL